MVENTKPVFVVDASFVLAFLLPDEQTIRVDSAFDRYARREIDFLSTQLLPFEVLNSIKTAILRNRLKKDLASQLVKKFFNYRIHLESIDFEKAFMLAQKQNLTVYDASYVVLAQTMQIPLFTLDKQLQKLIKITR